MKKRPGERQEPWLLIKATDDYAREPNDPDVLEDMPDSVATGRSIDQIAAGKTKIWHSNRPAKAASANAKPRGAAALTQALRKQSSVSRVKALEGTPGAKAGPMPAFIAPSLATLGDKAPAGDRWVHEVKFDGYRMQARLTHGGATLKTRNGLDWTRRFPTVAKACQALAPHEAILDGEIVSAEPGGVSDFSALQDDLKSGRMDRLAYYVFDLLHLDGRDLTGVALTERKRLLAQLMSRLPRDGVMRLSEHFETDGTAMLKHACQLGLEGIVSKRADAPYRSGRGGDWLKTKCASSQELVIVGYEPSDKRKRAIRSLLLGYYDDGTLRYAGRVGTGWGEALERDLSHRLTPLVRQTPTFDPIPPEERRRRVEWVAPKLVAEIDFRGWTGGHLVRQASFKGLREDKPARQVVREVQKAAPRTRQAALRRKGQTKTQRTGRSSSDSVAGVALSHPDRVYWEDAGVTKKMLADYYVSVWERMRPHVTGRVIALLRCPEGAAGECFFQKHASAGIDASHLQSVKEPDGEKSIAIDDLAGLISLVQAGVLEIHLRGSTVEHLEEADRLVFDLDPGPGVEWRDIVAAARELRQRLEALKLKSFVKTTGGKGLHVVVPIQPVPWDEAKDFCRGLAEQLAAEYPDRFTATLKKSARNHRIFIDYLRNSREATAIAPYSTRARPGASVATPLTWDELGRVRAANVFTVKNIERRLARLRTDPWATMGRTRQRLPALAARQATRRAR
jgi:bifunctional non-homologous end joining protein LigD